MDTHQNLDSLLLHWGLVIRGVADSHQCVNVKFLELLTTDKRGLERREREERPCRGAGADLPR